MNDVPERSLTPVSRRESFFVRQLQLLQHLADRRPRAVHPQMLAQPNRRRIRLIGHRRLEPLANDLTLVRAAAAAFMVSLLFSSTNVPPAHHMSLLYRQLAIIYR